MRNLHGSDYSRLPGFTSKQFRIRVVTALLMGLIMITGCLSETMRSDAEAGFLRTPSPTPTLIPLPSPATATPTPTDVPTLTLTATYDPGDAAAMLAAGNRNFATGNLPGALNDYSLAIRADPEYAEAYYRRGLAYTAFGHLDAALDDLNRVLDLTPDEARALVARADVWRLLMEYENALVDLTLAEHIDPTYGLLYLVRGKLYTTLGDNAAALKDLEAAVIALPTDAQAYIARAHIYYQMDKPSVALIDLNVALALSPHNVDALAARGEVFQRLDQPEQAIADFEAALAEGLPTYTLLLHLGQVYLSNGQYEEAENALSRAVSVNPDEADGHYWRGLAAFAGANYAQAVNSAGVVLAYEPRNLEAFALRATANLYRGYLSSAQADFEAAYGIDPSYVEALIGLAEIHIRHGDYPAALEALTTYLDNAPPGAPSRSAAQAAIDAMSAVGTVTPPPTLLGPKLDPLTNP